MDNNEDEESEENVEEDEEHWNREREVPNKGEQYEKNNGENKPHTI